jgi:prepilin-type processing-associated H-X9-DG protein
MADYRGPIKDSQVASTSLSALADGLFSGLPIGMDALTNHKGTGGNVLRFDGSVSFWTGTEYTTDANNKCTD